jgi:hypothetical protein
MYTKLPFLKMMQMSGLDLNAIPSEDELFYDTEPQFCTQAVPEEMVGESPNPIGIGQAAEVGGSDVHSAGGLDNHGEANAAGGNSIPTTTIPTESTTYRNLEEGATDGDGVHEEVASSPQEPFIGMRFDTIEAARAHYNAYALKKGFSVKNHTSKRNTRTNELEKQQFVCNKFRRAKTEEELQKERMTVLEDIMPVQLDEDSEEEDGEPSKTSSRLGVKRKRESIVQTKCPARMFVKMVNNKWQVTYFIAEHNHPMVEKPSLTKYLRSHRGIPKDEREFLRCLHNCNLETGLLNKLEKKKYSCIQNNDLENNHFLVLV